MEAGLRRGRRVQTSARTWARALEPRGFHPVVLVNDRPVVEPAPAEELALTSPLGVTLTGCSLEETFSVAGEPLALDGHRLLQPDVSLPVCWVHARRGFIKDSKRDDPVADEAARSGEPGWLR